MEIGQEEAPKLRPARGTPIAMSWVILQLSQRMRSANHFIGRRSSGIEIENAGRTLDILLTWPGTGVPATPCGRFTRKGNMR